LTIKGNYREAYQCDTDVIKCNTTLKGEDFDSKTFGDWIA